MRTKASVYIATSLIGFIAREDGALDWLNEANATVPEGEDCGSQAFNLTARTRQVNSALGTQTYEELRGSENE